MRLGSTTENASRGDRSLRATIGQSDVTRKQRRYRYGRSATAERVGLTDGTGRSCAETRSTRAEGR